MLAHEIVPSRCSDRNNPSSDLHNPGPNAPGLSSAHIYTRSTVGSHIGGTLSRIKRWERQGRCGRGGRREAVKEFSRASRRRMLDLLNSINRQKAPIPLFLTLTYPDVFPEDMVLVKKHIKTFRERFERKWGRYPVIWRLEFKRRKSGKNRGKVAPHLHFLFFRDLEPSVMYEWLSRSWYEVVGSGDPRHLRSGTRVEKVHSWRGVLSYAAKYMGKLEQLQGPESPGRFWGVWNRRPRKRNGVEHRVPGVVYLEDWIDLVEVQIHPDDAVRIRRHMARYAGIGLKKYAESPQFKAYVPSDVVRRLLEYYGYYRP